MSIEQHAEDSITDYFESKERGDSKRITHYIARHMQSAIDEATAPLRQRIAELDRSLRQQNHEVCQTLGKALHYAWFKDDQANFPGATEADGVCVGDHVAETLATEAAKRIAALEGLGPLIPTLSRWGGYAVDEGWDDESDVTAILTKINAILKGGAK